MSKKPTPQTDKTKKPKLRLLTWLGIVLPSSVAMALGIVE